MSPLTEIDLVSFFSNNWSTIPREIQLIILAIFCAALLLAIVKEYQGILKWGWTAAFNIYFWIQLSLNQHVENKRLETLLNWRKTLDYEHGEFSYNSIKVEDVLKSGDEKSFVNSTKRGAILVLKQKTAENKSENLAKATSQAMICGFLADVRQFLSPDLITAMTNVEILEELEKMRDFEAIKLATSQLVTTPSIEQLTNTIHDLKTEGIYQNIFVPYLIKLKSLRVKSKPRCEVIQKDATNLLTWLYDYEKRRVDVFASSYFPRTSFLYVRLLSKPLRVHIQRAIHKFENQNCDVQVVSGWGEQENDVKKVSNSLTKEYGYPFIKSFRGLEKEYGTKHKIQCLREESFEYIQNQI